MPEAPRSGPQRSGDADEPQASRRLTVVEAADQLGMSVDAVRGRVKRGTLRSEREGGAVYVLLDDELAGDWSAAGDDRPTDQSAKPQAELVEQLRSEVAYLRDESRRKDEIIMQQSLTVRQLTAPSGGASEATEPSGSPETVSEAAGGGDAPPEGRRAGERPPWWRRIFVGGG
jgi:hypothetical protein